MSGWEGHLLPNIFHHSDLSFFLPTKVTKTPHTNEIQEVAIVNNGYSGQYGRAAGANMNFTAKSGGNSFHGNAKWDWNGDTSSRHSMKGCSASPARWLHNVSSTTTLASA
jgi:hypothetical protein